MDEVLQNFDIKGKTILLRLDLNVPVDGGKVTDHTRIDRVKPTIEALRARGAKIVILSHFGRPKGKPDAAYSLAFLAPVLAARWGCPVSFAPDCIGPDAATAVKNMRSGDVLLLENLRFHAGEEKDDPAFAAQLAGLGDMYINDAFSVSHRAHASVHALARLLPAQPGPTMKAELAALGAALQSPKRPVAAIVGGSKISTKLDLLGNLVTKMDVLVLGGGMANTFLAARGWDPQASLVEPDMYETARQISRKAEDHGCRIILPVDGAFATKFAADAPHKTAGLTDIPAGWWMLDVGPESVKLIEEALSDCKTILWNGPLGAFELPNFAKGTTALAVWVAARTKAGRITSIAGGGDTVAALGNAGVLDDLSYVSTAGGAFLEWLEGKALPGVAVLAKPAIAA